MYSITPRPVGQAASARPKWDSVVVRFEACWGDEDVVDNALGAMQTSDEARIAEFLAEYDPDLQVLLCQSRQLLRERFPQGYELVFSTYNALVFGISPSERSSESFISVAGYPRWVNLFFLHGASLHDPSGLLEGNGKQIRSIKLTSAAKLSSPQVEALVAQAARPFLARLAIAPRLSTVIKAVAAKRRPRRAVTQAGRTTKTRAA